MLRKVRLACLLVGILVMVTAIAMAHVHDSPIPGKEEVVEFARQHIENPYDTETRHEREAFDRGHFDNADRDRAAYEHQS